MVVLMGAVTTDQIRTANSKETRRSGYKAHVPTFAKSYVRYLRPGRSHKRKHPGLIREGKRGLEAMIYFTYNAETDTVSAISDSEGIESVEMFTPRNSWSRPEEDQRAPLANASSNRRPSEATRA